MDTTSQPALTSDEGNVLSDEWVAEHFDHMAPELGPVFDETVDRLRSMSPVAHSDRHGGFWIVAGYEEVLHVLQDWQTFRNGEGVSIPMQLSDPPLSPEESDPPVHREFKRLVNAYLTPSMVTRFEQPTRRVADELIGAFAASGRCEWMSAFANQFPRLTFFENVLHAPPEMIGQLSDWTDAISIRRHDYLEANQKLVGWIEQFVEDRRAQPAAGDVVDAIVNARIQGRPITHEEILGTLQILMLGGFETTSSALGHIVIRFARDPQLPVLLERQPQLIPDAVEEFLRLDSPVVAMARTVVRDVEIGGKQFRRGDRVLFHLSSANRDETEFEHPGTFLIDRDKNRHLAFGAGPHRCAGSSLARMNLRTALEQIVSRLHDIRIEAGAEPIQYTTASSRTPRAVPITFTPR